MRDHTLSSMRDMPRLPFLIPPPYHSTALQHQVSSPRPPSEAVRAAGAAGNNIIVASHHVTSPTCGDRLHTRKLVRTALTLTHESTFCFGKNAGRWFAAWRCLDRLAAAAAEGRRSVESNEHYSVYWLYAMGFR